MSLPTPPDVRPEPPLAPGPSTAPPNVEPARAATAAAVAHGTELRRELGLATLVLTQVLFVVGSGWVGTAARLGHQQIVWWGLAIVLFYLPQAAVVIWLSRLMPLEGGLYQWAKVGLNEFAGFLVAWNLWMYAILILPTFALMVSTNLSYVLGPAGERLREAPAYVNTVGALFVGLLVVVALLGLGVGKWLQSFGGAAQLLTYVALIAVPLYALSHGTITEYRPLAVAAPVFSVFTFNIFGKMGMGALSGFEYVAIMAGETKNPSRLIARSVVIATPIIAAMFVLGTGAVVALVPRDAIDLVSPIPQALTVGLTGAGAVRYVAPALTMALLVRQVGNCTYIFAGNTRLPMVAGWDGLLPAWFTRLHPTSRTPRNSILFVGAIVLTLTMLSLVGAGLQEAFQLVENAAGILYGLTYLAMFAIPLVGGRRLGQRPSPWLRAAAASGFAVTLLYTILSVWPIIDVARPWIFAAKITVTVLAVNALGVWIYAAARRRRAAAG